MTKIENKEELDNILSSNADKLYVLDFSAPWCGPCKTLGHIIESLKEDELDNAEIISINVDDAEEVSDSYSIRNVPTLLFIKNNFIIDRSVGGISKEVLLGKIKENNAK